MIAVVHVDRAMLESVFPADALFTLPESAVRVVLDPSARVFLRDTGVPALMWFDADMGIGTGKLDCANQELSREYPEFDIDFSKWALLGSISTDPVYLDVSDGSVHSIPDGGTPALLNSDIESLAYFLCLLEMERPNYDFDALGEEGSYVPGAEDRLRELMTASDPRALSPVDNDSEYDPGEPTWEMVLRFVAEKLQ